MTECAPDCPSRAPAPPCPICGLAAQVNGCHRGDGGAWVCNRPFRVVDLGGGKMLVEGPSIMSYGKNDWSEHPGMTEGDHRGEMQAFAAKLRRMGLTVTTLGPWARLPPAKP